MLSRKVAKLVSLRAMRVRPWLTLRLERSWGQIMSGLVGRDRSLDFILSVTGRHKNFI